MAQHKQIVQIIELGVAQTQPDHINVSRALTALAQEAARSRVAAAAPAALIDSSTGTANSANALVSVGTPVQAMKDGVTEHAPKAAFDTAVGKVDNANAELATKVNALIALIGGGTANVADVATNAAAATGTIAALDLALAGAATNVVAAATGTQQIVILRNNQASIASAINWCRVAMGLAPITDNSGGMFEKSQTTAWPSQDVAATAAAVTANGAMTLTDASVDAALDALADNVASMASALNQMRGTVAIGPFVIATHNAHTRLQIADTTV